MKNIIILIGSRLINGIFGLLLFGLLKAVISNEGYVFFSSSFANLSLLSTLAGGVLSGLLLKNAFYFGSAHQRIIYFYIGLFLILMVAPLELAFIFKIFPALSRWVVYLFIISHLFSSVALVHYQLKQQFIIMSAIEIFRTLFPLVLVLISKYGLHVSIISIDMVILLMASGNLLGLYLFIMRVYSKYSGEIISIKDYLKERIKTDLWYGFSFASFNALAQLIIARDRSFILLNPNLSHSSKVAYSADQLTKVTNGVLFPLNTKVSSELGGLVRGNEVDVFHHKLNVYSFLTLVFGSIITLSIYGLTYVYGHIKLLKDLDNNGILYYGLANTIYLTCLVYQKRFDYTKFKLLPMLLLFFAGGLALLLVNLLFVAISYFFVTTIIFGLFLLLAGLVLPQHKLQLSQ